MYFYFLFLFPFFFPFFFSSSFPLPTSSNPTLPNPNPKLQNEKGIGEAFKPSPQVVFNDLLGRNGQNFVTCDDFFVDDLLDFSNGDGFVEEEPEEEEDKGFASVSPSKQAQELESSNPIKHEFVVSVPSAELTILAYDLANLEWLSHFVEDSFTEFFVPFLAEVLSKKPKIPTKQKPHSLAKPLRVWSLGFPSLTDYSSSPSSSSLSSQSSPWLISKSKEKGIGHGRIGGGGEGGRKKKEERKRKEKKVKVQGQFCHFTVKKEVEGTQK
ncbi:hypothetical protein UlMin_013860 [Ulmus minor]